VQNSNDMKFKNNTAPRNYRRAQLLHRNYRFPSNSVPILAGLKINIAVDIYTLWNRALTIGLAFRPDLEIRA